MIEKEKRLNKQKGQGYLSNKELREKTHKDKLNEDGKLNFKPLHTNIDDVCRIPSTYVKHSREERLQESCDVLAKM